jgi:hypothetical protein
MLLNKFKHVITTQMHWPKLKNLWRKKSFFSNIYAIEIKQLEKSNDKLKYSKQIISKTSLGFTTKIKYGGWNLFWMEWNNIFCDLCVFSHVISSMLLTHEHMSVSSQFVNVNCKCDFMNKKKSLWYIHATWQEYFYHMDRIFFLVHAHLFMK